MHALSAVDHGGAVVRVVGAVPADDGGPGLPRFDRGCGPEARRGGQRGLPAELLLLVLIMQTAGRLVQRGGGGPEHGGKRRGVVHALENAIVPRVSPGGG